MEGVETEQLEMIEAGICPHCFAHQVYVGSDMAECDNCGKEWIFGESSDDEDMEIEYD